jgi:hypothetical protein
MTKIGDRVSYIRGICRLHGKLLDPGSPITNRAQVQRKGFLVHGVKMALDPNDAGGVLNGFSADGKRYTMTKPGGDKAVPYKDPYLIHALWVRLDAEYPEYTFMGVFEADPASTDALRIYNRIDDKYDPAASDMAITGFV